MGANADQIRQSDALKNTVYTVNLGTRVRYIKEPPISIKEPAPSLSPARYSYLVTCPSSFIIALSGLSGSQPQAVNRRVSRCIEEQVGSFIGRRDGGCASAYIEE